MRRKGKQSGGKRGAAAGAGSGAAEGAVSAFESGHDLILEKGTALEIRLDRNLAVPVALEEQRLQQRQRVGKRSRMLLGSQDRNRRRPFLKRGPCGSILPPGRIFSGGPP